MRVEGRKTLFSALVDCAKGFLSAEERDRMANFIRPDSSPLPPVTTSVTPGVTRTGDMPLGVTPQPSITTSSTHTHVVTTAVVVTVTVTIATTTSAAVATTAAPPVTATVTPSSMAAGATVRVSSVGVSFPTNIMPQVGMVLSSQQSLAPVVGATGTTLAVTAGRALVTPQPFSGVAVLPALPSLSGMFSSASQGQSALSTSITPSGSKHPVSHPIDIEPQELRPPTGVMMGVEGLTLPSDPKAMITATVPRLVAPVDSQTSLQGLASHQATGMVSRVGVSTLVTIIDTIHGPGLPGPITIAGGSTEPEISIIPPQEKESQVFMVVEDDNVVEVSRTQRFTRLIEPKRERMDPPTAQSHTSRG